jgi:hypothetical protein
MFQRIDYHRYSPMMPLRDIANNPEKQGVSTIVRTSQFFPRIPALSEFFSHFLHGNMQGKG